MVRGEAVAVMGSLGSGKSTLLNLIAGMPWRKIRAWAAELLARLGVDRYRNSYPGRLSGGDRAER